MRNVYEGFFRCGPYILLVFLEWALAPLAPSASNFSYPDHVLVFAGHVPSPLRCPFSPGRTRGISKLPEILRKTSIFLLLFGYATAQKSSLEEDRWRHAAFCDQSRYFSPSCAHFCRAHLKLLRFASPERRRAPVPAHTVVYPKEGYLWYLSSFCCFSPYRSNSPSDKSISMHQPGKNPPNRSILFPLTRNIFPGSLFHRSLLSLSQYRSR